MIIALYDPNVDEKVEIFGNLKLLLNQVVGIRKQIILIWDLKIRTTITKDIVLYLYRCAFFHVKAGQFLYMLSDI